MLHHQSTLNCYQHSTVSVNIIDRKTKQINPNWAMYFLAFLSSFSLVILTHSVVQAEDGTGCEITNDPSISNSFMTCLDKHTLEEGALLGTLPKLGKEWEISFKFSPFTKPHPIEKSNIIRISDSTSTRTNIKDAGIFSIWTLPGQDLHFTGKHGDKESWSKNYNVTRVGWWTEISFSQKSKITENTNCLKYQQVIKINNRTEIFRRIHRVPQEFEQVDVFASASS